MRHEGANVLKVVKVNKEDLLKVVIENRGKHVNEYQESLEDYKKAILKLAHENLKLAKTGDIAAISRHKSWPSAPLSYESEYNRAIKMLEMSVDNELEIESHVFNQLAMDEWSWKGNFALMASTYKGML